MFQPHPISDGLIRFHRQADGLWSVRISAFARGAYVVEVVRDIEHLSDSLAYQLRAFGVKHTKEEL